MQSPLIQPKAFQPKNKRQTIIIILGIGVFLGFYFSQDQPQALQSVLQNKQLNFRLTSSQFNLIYFTTMFPNVLLNVIGGVIIDKVGVIKSVVLFGFFIFAAQALVTFSIFWRQNNADANSWYILLLIGRGFFGVAGQNIHTVVSAIVTIIIPSERLSTGLGLCLSIPFAFGALNSIVSTSVYEAFQKLYLPFAIGSAACFLSFVFSIITALYFRKITKKVQDSYVQNQQSHAEKIECSKITKLGSTFWLLILLCCNMAGLWYGFLDNAIQCLQIRFNYSNKDAGKLVMIPYIICAVCCPFYGYIAAKFLQKRRLLILTVPIICTIAHTIMFVLPNLNTPSQSADPTALETALIALFFFLLGLSYSGYVSMIVPSISMVADQSILGTAFGLVGMANALSQSFFPMISALIVQQTIKSIEHGHAEDQHLEHYAQGQGYKNNSIFYMGIGILTVVVAFFLFISKQKQARQLDTLDVDIQIDEIDWDADIRVEQIDKNFEFFFKKKNMTQITEKSIQSSMHSQLVMRQQSIRQE